MPLLPHKYLLTAPVGNERPNQESCPPKREQEQKAVLTHILVGSASEEQRD
jgi:hypothetical protein